MKSQEKYVIEGNLEEDLGFHPGMTVAQLCEAIAADLARHGVRGAEFSVSGTVNGAPVMLKFSVRMEPTRH